VTIPDPPRPRPIPALPSRESLLAFVRAHAPDIRIRKARLEDGRRACWARFTFRGEQLDVEAVEVEGLDPDDAIVRRCAYLLYRRLGIRTWIEAQRGDALEQEIVNARARGNGELADRLGLELVLFNEGRTRPANAGPMGIRGRFER